MGKFPTSLVLYYMFHASIIFGTFHLMPQLTHYQNRKSIIFWISTSLSFISSLAVYLKDPGHLTQQYAKQINTNPSPHLQGFEPQNPLEMGKNIIDPISNQNYQKRFCRLCNVSQPFRAKHCHDCGKCVSTFDHHCFMLSNCIGEKNRHYFYIFLLIESGALSYNMFLVSSKIQFMRTDIILLCVLGGLCLFLAMCLILLVFHTYLMFKGITTWEYFSWKYISYLTGYKKNKSPFSKGVCHNISTYWTSGCRASNKEWVHQFCPENI